MFSRSQVCLLAAFIGGALVVSEPALAQSTNLSALHDALHLSGSQEGAWRAYTKAVSPDPTADSRRRAAAMLAPTLTTPRRVDLINAEMEEEMNTVRSQGDAVKAFYASLTPEQQRAFDHQTAQAPSGPPTQPNSGKPALRQPPAGTLAQPSAQR